jgi:phasin family protein
MYATPEQFSASSKAGVEALVGLANAHFAALERLSALNFSASKSAFEDCINYARALAGAKDAQEFANLSTTATQPTLEKALAYSRNVYELSTQAQSEFTKALEAQAAEFNKSMAVLLEKVSKNAPAGSDVAIAAVRSALAAANTAYDNFSKVAKQASDVVETNFAAATSAAKETRKKAV